MPQSLRAPTNRRSWNAPLSPGPAPPAVRERRHHFGRLARPHQGAPPNPTRAYRQGRRCTAGSRSVAPLVVARHSPLSTELARMRRRRRQRWQAIHARSGFTPAMDQSATRTVERGASEAQGASVGFRPRNEPARPTAHATRHAVWATTRRDTVSTRHSHCTKSVRNTAVRVSVQRKHIRVRVAVS